MSIDVSQFHQTFFEESVEGLDVMEAGLLGLDTGAVDSDTVHAIFRAAHSIKGGAGTFGFTAIASFTHAMETLLDEVREGRRGVTQELVDVLLQSVDCLRAMLAAAQGGEDFEQGQATELQQRMEAMLDQAPAGEAPNEADKVAVAQSGRWQIAFRPHDHMLRTGNDPLLMFRELEALGKLEVTADIEALPAFTELDPEACHLAWRLELTTEAPLEKIREIFEWVEDDCDLQIEPLVDAAAPAAAAGDTPDAPAQAKQRAPAENSSIRVSIDKVDALINMVGELVITQSMIGSVDGSLEEFDANRLEKLREGLTLLERNTRELQESVMRIRMVPISFAFSRFPRMVRDISQQFNKKIEFKTSGEQTELDKTVMEKIGDPLVHLVRNALDHGIELPEARLAKGKPEAGTLHLNAYHQGGNIVIEISDDGAGLDRERILAKARARGLIEDDASLSDEQIHELIFQPGFSTAESVSDLSGRGVGMDVVRRNIRALGGSVEVRAVQDQGTTFTIKLPLTLAILDGQLVRVGSEIYIIPLVSIVESLQVRPEHINAIAGKADLYRVRDEYIPIIALHALFGVPTDNTRIEDGLLVVIEGDGQKVGLFVEELLAQQQVVIKSLKTNFRPVEGISGATILGNGDVGLILDVAGLVNLSHTAGPQMGEQAVA